LSSALASWGVSASSRSHAMRSALIAASWAQAVLIAQFRRGSVPGRSPSRGGSGPRPRAMGSVAGLQEHQLPGRGVGRHHLVAPPVGLFEQGQLRVGVGLFPTDDQAHPGRPPRTRSSSRWPNAERQQRRPQQCRCMNVRMTRAVEIPAQARPWRAHKPASRTGKAHWFLSEPTASSRHCCQARWCWFPPRLHTPAPDIPAGQRAGSPASTVVCTATCVRIPHKPRTRPIRFARLRRSQACDPRS